MPRFEFVEQTSTEAVQAQVSHMRLTFFKPNGKFYTILNVTIVPVAGTGFEDSYQFMQAVVDYVRSLKYCRGMTVVGDFDRNSQGYPFMVPANERW